MAKNRGCEHIFGDGDTCGSPALLGERYCHYHLRYKRNQRLPTDDDYEFPILEDRDAIQLLVSDIMRGILKGKIDTKTANSLLYATQIASSNISRWTKVPDDEDGEENESAQKEEKVPIMVKLLTEALADLKIIGGPDDGKPAAEVIGRAIQDATSRKP